MHPIMPTPYKRRGNPDLPQDIILEILLRLPVKTLLRLKCVCKKWNTIIASQSFVSQHYGHSTKKERLLISCNDPVMHQQTYSMLLSDDTFSAFKKPAHLQFPYTVSKVMGAVNGVFCLVCPRSVLALVNPATRKLKLLPKQPDWPFERLLFVPEDVFGFGLDPLSGDLKVVAIWYLRGETGNHPQAFVYSLSSGSWRNVASFESRYIAFNTASFDQYCNGVYYWIMGTLWDGDVRGLLAFNVSTEKFEQIEVPDCVKSKVKAGVLNVQGDSIALLTLEFKVVYMYEVWVMEKKARNWCRVAVCCPFQVIGLPVCLWRNNQLIFQSSDSHLSLYDIFTKKLRHSVAQFSDLTGFLSYKESLVSIGDNCMVWDASTADELRIFLP